MHVGNIHVEGSVSQIFSLYLSDFSLTQLLIPMKFISLNRYHIQF